MDLDALTDQLRELLEYELQKYSVTQPVPKLKKKPGGGQGYSDKSGASPAKTNASRPRSLAKKPADDDGGGTKAGVKHKDVREPEKTNDHTKASPKRDFQKTSVKGGGDSKTGSGKTGAGKSSPGKPTSCPGGGQPRMVFGKWRCAGGGSPGAQKAKSRISTKRKQKKLKPVKKGVLATLVHKARAAFKGMFK